MADLPPELFTEILSRSPVQSLLRFRSTSKSLKSIIDSHNFTNLHLKNSLNFNLILLHNSDLYQLDFPDLTARVKLRLSFTCSSNRTYVHGSCNGLLCISNGMDEIAFWNPNICKHHFIPCLTIPPRLETGRSINFVWRINFVCRIYGIGFDLFAADYKLVILYYVNNTFDSQVRLFSSKTNSWKVLPNIPYAFYSSETMGAFVENSLHWIVIQKLNRSESRLIIAFNLTQEVFNEVPLPVAVNRYYIDVSLLGGCLCITVNDHQNLQTDKIDVWVMKEYGVRDSWCKLFSCSNKPLLSSKPLCYSSDKNKVLLETYFKKLFWYDLKSEKVTCVLGTPKFNKAMIFVGSLLPPPLPIDQ